LDVKNLSMETLLDLDNAYKEARKNQNLLPFGI
jgi:hypothetical protein